MESSSFNTAGFYLCNMECKAKGRTCNQFEQACVYLIENKVPPTDLWVKELKFAHVINKPIKKF